MLELILAIIIGITFGILYIITILFFLIGMLNVKRVHKDVQEWKKDGKI